MPLITQDNPGGEDNAAQANSVATLPALKGSDQDAESRMLAGVILQHFDDDIKCSLKVCTMK